MEKRWKLLCADQEGTNTLVESLKINPILCKILAQREISSFDVARDYFRPSMQNLHDPFLMKDMDKAVNRIIRAISSGEKILVYGDYDVDGTTAVATLYAFLCSIYDPANIEYYIPHRYREGYGVSRLGIDHAAAEGIPLIIALDCGIKSVDLIDYALTLGIEFIVCDHHLPDAILPRATAILNPKQPGCPYPYKELCGCGVGYKLICALAETLQLDKEMCNRHLDLLATAIAADIVPMTGENRTLAYFGLQKANSSPNPGIQALKKLSNYDKDLHITNLVFLIAPRVNAAGRMDDAKKAVQLFIAENETEALEFAKMLHSDNNDRREADRSITDEALLLLKDEDKLLNKKSTVLFREHWHKGVVGIVASRLIDHYYRPTIVLTRSGEYAAGSARSVAGFNVYEAIHQCKDLLIGYGGHFYAAGMTLHPENIPAFQERFEEVVAATITEELLTPEIVIDAEIRFADITASFQRIIDQMEPYGPENLRPVFVARRVTNYASRIVREEHIKFDLMQDNHRLCGIGFNMASKFSLLLTGPVDIVFTIEENEWNNTRTLQLKVIDFRSAV